MLKKKAKQEPLIQTLVNHVAENDIEAFIRVLVAWETITDENVWEFYKKRD